MLTPVNKCVLGSGEKTANAASRRKLARRCRSGSQRNELFQVAVRRPPVPEPEPYGDKRDSPSGFCSLPVSFTKRG